jgi:hypothetical protein
MAFTMSNVGMLDILTKVIANVLDATGPAYTTVKLAKATFNPSPTLDPGTLVEADFTGYAAKAVNPWASPYLDGPAAETLSTTVLHWSPTDAVTPNTIYGYWLVAGDGTFLGAEKFATPVPLPDATAALNLVPVFQIPQLGFSAQVLA